VQAKYQPVRQSIEIAKVEQSNPGQANSGWLSPKDCQTHQENNAGGVEQWY
jgi:hypothetical protein